MRFKNRYFLCELIWEDGKIDESLNGYDIFRAARDSLQLNYGDFSVGSLSVSLNGTMHDEPAVHGDLLSALLKLR